MNAVSMLGVSNIKRNTIYILTSVYSFINSVCSCDCRYMANFGPFLLYGYKQKRMWDESESAGFFKTLT